jgi:hypothetical protein
MEFPIYFNLPHIKYWKVLVLRLTPFDQKQNLSKGLLTENIWKMVI